MFLADRIKQTVTVEGTYESNATLGAAVARHRSVTDEYNDADEFVYLIEADTGEWELGLGALQSLSASVTRRPIRSSAGASVGAVFPAGGTKTLSVIASAEWLGALMDVPTSGPAATGARPKVSGAAVNSVAIGRGSTVNAMAFQTVAMLGAQPGGGASTIAIGPGAIQVNGAEVRGLIHPSVHASPPLAMRLEACGVTTDATPENLMTAGGDVTFGAGLADVVLSDAWSNDPAVLVVRATVSAVRAPAVATDPPTCAVWTITAVYVTPPSGNGDPALAAPATVVQVCNTTGLAPTATAAATAPGITVVGDAAVTLRWGATIDVLAVRFPA